MVVGNFEDAYAVGDRIMLAVYNGTVMEIPDFTITPPSYIALAATTTVASGPSFRVARNAAFNSTVTLHLHGDTDAAAAGYPAHNLIPDPVVNAAGRRQDERTDLHAERVHPEQERHERHHDRLRDDRNPRGHLHRVDRGPLRQPVLPDATHPGRRPNRRCGA